MDKVSFISRLLGPYMSFSLEDCSNPSGCHNVATPIPKLYVVVR